MDWLAAAIEARGRPPSVADLKAAYGRACRGPDPTEPSLIAQMLRDFGVTAPEAQAIRRALPWDAVPLEAYPDALPALRRLQSAGFRVGVLANQPSSTESDLARTGIAGLCDGVWLSGTVGLAKPDPRFFRLALDAWDLPPDRVAYVGDRPDNDVAPAKTLGLATVRLRRGPHAEQAPRTAAERADVKAHDLTEAARHLVAWRASLDDA